MYRKEFVPKPLVDATCDFSGEVLHALNYKTWRSFEGKRVVVCGFGNTGGKLVID